MHDGWYMRLKVGIQYEYYINHKDASDKIISLLIVLNKNLQVLKLKL